jgi:hypothetical protein
MSSCCCSSTPAYCRHHSTDLREVRGRGSSYNKSRPSRRIGEGRFAGDGRPRFRGGRNRNDHPPSDDDDDKVNSSENNNSCEYNHNNRSHHRQLRVERDGNTSSDAVDHRSSSKRRDYDNKDYPARNKRLAPASTQEREVREDDDDLSKRGRRRKSSSGQEESCSYPEKRRKKLSGESSFIPAADKYSRNKEEQVDPDSITGKGSSNRNVSEQSDILGVIKQKLFFLISHRKLQIVPVPIIFPSPISIILFGPSMFSSR